jgi:8-oxo-dGTP pyrophosphatase MutT (NUDIX family)
LKKRKQAAVIVPVYRNKNDELMVVLLRRSEGDIHGGQIAFPGGKKSRKDKTLKQTALRETNEETGLDVSNIDIFEQLPEVYTQTSQFVITPFLAKIIPPKRWVPSEHEVDEIFEVSLKEIAKPGAHGEEIKNFKHWPSPRIVPFYRIGNYQIWGATYRILNPIIDDILGGKWNI